MDRAKTDNSANFLVKDADFAEAAGFKKWRYFRDTHLVAEASSLSGGVLSQHSGIFHYYEADGHFWTTPTSAAAGGETIRAMKRAAVPGWRKTDVSSGGNS